MILGLEEDIFLNRLLFEAFEYKTKKICWRYLVSSYIYIEKLKVFPLEASSKFSNKK